MPRPRRLETPGVTLHVVQRGNNRLPCFFRDHDRHRYLDLLGELLDDFGCKLHAYVLMTNHVHLLLTPSRPRTVSALMQNVGSRYARFVNLSTGRTGTLWEGRFKSFPVDGAHYALACTRYIELNPVRAGMVAHPGSYRWSSIHFNAFGRADPLVTTHPALDELAVEPALRRARYRELIAAGQAQDELDAIRQCAAKQKAWGAEAFIATLGPDQAGQRKAGRPRNIVTTKLLL